MLICSQGENMAQATKNILIYGVPFSQPVRAVMWLMLIKKFPFKLKLTNPGSSSEGGSRHPDFLKNCSFVFLSNKLYPIFHYSLVTDKLNLTFDRVCFTLIFDGGGMILS